MSDYEVCDVNALKRYWRPYDREQIMYLHCSYIGLELRLDTVQKWLSDFGFLQGIHFGNECFYIFEYFYIFI